MNFCCFSMKCLDGWLLFISIGFCLLRKIFLLSLHFINSQRLLLIMNLKFWILKEQYILELHNNLILCFLLYHPLSNSLVSPNPKSCFALLFRIWSLLLFMCLWPWYLPRVCVHIKDPALFLTIFNNFFRYHFSPKER